MKKMKLRIYAPSAATRLKRAGWELYDGARNRKQAIESVKGNHGQRAIIVKTNRKQDLTFKYHIWTKRKAPKFGR